MSLRFLPWNALPGHLQGRALCFGTLPLTHGFTFQHTGPTSAYPGYYSRPLLLRASCSPAASGWRLLYRGTFSTEGCWRFLRSQFPWLTSLGRCSPPGLSAVQTGQYRGMPAPYPVPFGSSASASCADSLSRWLNHTFASATRRCLLDGIPGVRLPGSAVYPRFRPLRASRRPGGYAVTPAPGGVGIELRRARRASTFPQAPLRSRTVGFPEYGSDPGFPLKVFLHMRKLKRWLAYTPLISSLPSGSSEKASSSDSRR